MRAVVIVLAACVLLYVAAGAALYILQRRILFVPDTARPDAAAVGLPSLQTPTLVTADGLHLLAWYLPAPPGAPTIAYFHGNGGNLANRAGRLRRFAEAGWSVLMPEYRGYGGNAGEPSEHGFDLDADAAMAFLVAHGVAPVHTIIYGESIGTGVATFVAAQRPFAALILESPYTSITAIAGRRYPVFPVGLMLRDPFDSLGRIGRVRSPILMIQGAEDTIVPPALGRELFAAAPEPKRLWVSPDAGHNDLMQHGAFAVIEAFVCDVTAGGTACSTPAASPPR